MNITIETDISFRNGSARGPVEARAFGRVIHSDTVNLLSAQSRGRFGKAAVGKAAAAKECPAGFDAVAAAVALEAQLVEYGAALPDEHDEGEDDAPEHARPKPPPRDRDTYALTPGAHKTEDSYLEQGAHDFTAEVTRLLPEGVYRRGNVAGTVDHGSATFRELTNEATRSMVDRSAPCRSWVIAGRGEEAHPTLVYRSCTRDWAGLVLDHLSTAPEIPVIRTLTRYPVFLPDWQLSPAGYCNGVYYDEPPELMNLRIETDPNVIRDTLSDLGTDFPFKDRSDEVTAIAGLLTPLVRETVRAVPAFLAVASMPGTGKTRWIEEVTGITVSGRETPALQLSDDEAELEKRIIAMLLRGETMVHLDNVPSRLDSPALASLLTAKTFSGRLLGSSRILELPNNVTIFLSGNNLQASPEIARRVLPIRLEPRTQNPELRRDFAHPDLGQYLRTSRRRVLGCLIGMVRNWADAGAQPGMFTLGSFEEWSKIISGILEHHGLYGLGENRPAWTSFADQRSEDVKALVKEWQQMGGMPMTGAELLNIARRLDLFSEIWGPREGKSAEVAFGMRVLRTLIDQPVGINIFFRRIGTSRPAVYSLREEV